MPTWLDAVVVGFLVTLVIYLVYKNFKARVLFNALSELHLQLLADKTLLERKVNELFQEIENTKLEQSDGFVKFLSDSRDWAFEYIEQTQDALSNFDIIIESVIDWNNTYGSVTGDNSHSDKIKQISVAYEQLKKVLPQDKTPNN
jgi:hypothetical protein